MRQFLSVGFQELGLGFFTALVAAVLLWFCFKNRRASTGLTLFDLTYGIVVLVSLLSYLFFVQQHLLWYKSYNLFAAFFLYLFLRLTYQQYLRRFTAYIFVFFLAIASLEAASGLAQYFTQVEMKGHFFNVNFFAMYIAISIPLALSLLFKPRMKLPIRLLLGFTTGLLLLVVLLSKCRTAYIGLLIVLPAMFLVRYFPAFKDKYPKPARFLLPAAGASSVLLAAGMAVLFFLLKPLSFVGRFLTWKVSLAMWADSPLLGVGWGNYAGLYNLYLGRYFEQGTASHMERMSPSIIQHAFNDYLQSVVGLGIIGLIILLFFWVLIFRNVWRVFLQHYRENPFITGAVKAYTLGAAGAVLLFMLMSFTYYPARILPIAIIFNVCLALVVSANRKPPEENLLISTKASAPPCTTAWYFLIFLTAAALIGSVIALPHFFKQGNAEREWARASDLLRNGNQIEALRISERIYPDLRGDYEFVYFFGGLLRAAGEVDKVIAYLEPAKVTYSHPFMLEDLARAYSKKGNLTEAVKNAYLASTILPWRLTAKSLLADLYYQQGDYSRAAEYAGLVLATPMKISTEKGLELKADALHLLQKLHESHNIPQNRRDQAVALLPADYQLKVTLALIAAQDNATQLIEAVFSLDQEMRPGLAFLLANMPESDLRSLTANFLTQNIRLAYLARQENPHVQDVPEDIFLNYVLPYAVLYEQRENWRPDFYNKFMESAKNSPSLEMTFIDLNREAWPWLNVFFDQKATFYIRSPSEVREKGRIFCGDASLILVYACRAVGIPARLVFIPRWTHAKGGHIWLEVYDQGKWYGMAAYDPGRFGEGWVPYYAAQTDPSKPEHRIYAVSFKKTDLHMVHGEDISLVDVTDSYLALRSDK